MTTTALAECAARLVPDAASRFVAALEPWADEMIVWGSTGIVLGSTARTLGELHLAAGQRDEARARFDAARALESALGSAIAVRSTLLAADARAASPDEADRDEAARLRADALDAARDHGLRALAETESARAAATPRITPAAPAVHPGGMTVPAVAVNGDGVGAPTGTTTAGTTTEVRCFGAFALRVGGTRSSSAAFRPGSGPSSGTSPSTQGRSCTTSS